MINDAKDVNKIKFQHYKYLHGFEIKNITSTLQSQFHILLFTTPNYGFFVQYGFFNITNESELSANDTS